jgi:hypothetical protein
MRTFTIARLANRYQTSDPVKTDEGMGVVIDAVSGDVTWPPGDDDGETLEGSADSPVYIVALDSGGSQPFKASDLSKLSGDDPFGVKDTDAKMEDVDDAELSALYDGLDDPNDLEEVELALGGAVEDPGIGFDSWPDSWEESDKPARLIALDAWTSMQATWRGCFAEIGSKRICSAFKDSILGTENWRGGWD